jgi:sterol 3beta-glucosyltransferase
MRIVIIAPGSRGDVEPYIALGVGLQKAGHVIRLVTHENFESLVRSYGIDFWPVAGSVQDIAASPEMRALLEKGNNLAMMRQMAKEAERNAVAGAKGGLAACKGMELVLAGIGGLFIAAHLAEKFRIPLLQAYYIPFTPTRAYPSFSMAKIPSWFGGSLNRLSYHLTRQVMWLGFRAADKLARQKVLHLPDPPFFGPYKELQRQHLPVLYGYSPSVIQPPPDWDENIHVTGYWFLDPPADWAPPRTLVDFLQAGPPPIYVGFGSMSHRNPEETTDLIVQALNQTSQRGIIQSGWSGLNTSNLPESIYMLDACPFSWLFPRVAVVVHHGGAGTTAAGLRAGVPSVVIPFFGDQPYWGQRVAELGVGPQPISQRKLTVELLVHAIRTAVTDQTMRRCAVELGEKIQAEDGIASAVTVVQHMENTNH